MSVRCEQHLSEAPGDLCLNTATHRFFWPGSDPGFICEDCARWLLTVAAHMGFSVPLQTLTEVDHEAHDLTVAKQVAERLGSPR